MQQTRFLPLFPLNTVLFPGLTLPLHVFEERYKLMLKHCLEEDRALGIVLIKSGWEAGGPAIPFEVGTLARIVHVENRQDGTIDLTVIGERRFRIRSVVDGEPYAIGDVALIDDEPIDVPDRLVSGVREMFTEYVQTLRGLANRSEGPVRLPESAIELSCIVAASMQITRQEQQALLEDPPGERLRHEKRSLRRELALLGKLGAVTVRRLMTPPDFSHN